MGQILFYECLDSRCGWQTFAYVGGGMRSLGQLPHLCRHCRHLTMVDGGTFPEDGDWTTMPDIRGKCSRCRRLAEPWPELDKNGQEIRHPTCPKCLQPTIRTTESGIWN